MSSQQIIENLWDQKDTINFLEDTIAKEAVNIVLDQLDNVSIRVCEKNNSKWNVNQWIKKAILLSFKTKDMGLIKGGPSFDLKEPKKESYWWDKVPSKFEGWGWLQALVMSRFVSIFIFTNSRTSSKFFSSLTSIFAPLMGCKMFLVASSGRDVATNLIHFGHLVRYSNNMVTTVSM